MVIISMDLVSAAIDLAYAWSILAQENSKGHPNPERTILYSEVAEAAQRRLIIAVNDLPKELKG